MRDESHTNGKTLTFEDRREFVLLCNSFKIIKVLKLFSLSSTETKNLNHFFLRSDFLGSSVSNVIYFPNDISIK